MDDNFVTGHNLESARTSSADLRNLLACMHLAASHSDPDYHEIAVELYHLAFALCDDVNISLAPGTNGGKFA